MVRDEYETVLNQQILIVKLGEGFTFKDTEDMDAYERMFVLRKLMEMKKQENEMKEKAIQQMKNKK